MSSDEALQKIQSSNTVKTQADMAIVQSLFGKATANESTSVGFRYRQNLKKLMDITNRHNGDRSKLYTGFYGHFIKNESDFDMTVFDVSGLLFYLITIVVMAVVCVAIYSIFVLPEFQKLFSGFGQKLPALTSIVLRVTTEFSAIIIAVVALFIGSTFMLTMYVKNTLRRLTCFRSFLVRFPVIGGVARKYNQYLQLSFIHLLINANVEAKQAIEEVVANFGDDLNILGNSKNNKSENIPALQMAMELDTFSEELEFQLAQLGLQGINDFTKMKSSITVVSIVTVAAAVGTVIIAMYLPIFQMGKVIG
jgi:type IV pilus assembly protein PilC